MAFTKGKSGNPGGRAKGYGDIREIAREHGARAVEVLVEIMEDTEAPATSRQGAAQALLDRGYGKPPADVKISGPGFRVVINKGNG